MFVKNPVFSWQQRGLRAFGSEKSAVRILQIIGLCSDSVKQEHAPDVLLRNPYSDGSAALWAALPQFKPFVSLN